MAFLKRVALSLGLTLSFGANAKADETAEKPEQAPAENQPSQWTIVGTTAGAYGSAYYMLPEGFKLTFDGTLKGHGFKWKLGDDDFYYRGTRVLNYLGSLKRTSLGDNILIDDRSLSDIFNAYTKIEEADKSKLEDLIHQIEKEIYKDAGIGEQPPGGSANSEPLSKEKELDKLRQFIENPKTLSADDKEEIRGLLKDFSEAANEIIDQMKLAGTLKKVNEDPMRYISIYGSTLLEINSVLDDLGKFMHVQKDKNNLRIKGTIKAKGSVNSGWSATYKLERGKSTREFNHALSIDELLFGQLSVDVNLALKENGLLSLHVPEEGMRYLSGHIGKYENIDFTLYDADLNAAISYMFFSSNRISESFQLSEPTKHGQRGVGAYFGVEQSRYQHAQLKADAHLSMTGETFNGALSLDNELTYMSKTRTGLYLFDEGERRSIWHYGMLGIGYYDLVAYGINESADAGQSVSINEKPQNAKLKINRHYTYKNNQRLVPIINLSVGSKGLIVNPFISYASFPHETTKVGIIEDIPFLPTKFHMRVATDKNSDIRNKRKEELALETSLILFDGAGNEKTISYYIKSEQLDASPKTGKVMDERNSMADYYSGIDGIIATAKIAGDDYRLRGVWCADSPFFLGASYFGNKKEQLQGGDILIGYNNLLLTARAGASQKNRIYSRLFDISLAGGIGGKMLYLDMHGIAGPFPEERHYEMQYFQSQALTLNLLGAFDENNLLRIFRRSVKPDSKK